MARKTIVLGAGMVGVSIAWHLQNSGRQVILLDKKQAGQETSFGNAGLIQREAVKPHPFPRQLSTLLRIACNRSSDIRYHLPALFSEMGPLWRYWQASAPAPFAKTVTAYASLIAHCTQDHETLFTAAKAQHLIQRDGWLQIYRQPKRLTDDLEEAAIFEQRFGVKFKPIDNAELHIMEPGLTAQAIGAIHWTNAWSVTDPGVLVTAYADDFQARGGQFYQAEATALQAHVQGWRVHTGESHLEADELVLATGPWSNIWTRQLGYRIPLFVQRGYHMHYTDGIALHRAILDIDKGYVIAPKQAGIRLTSGAELNRQHAAPDYRQLAAAERAAREIFKLGKRKQDIPWMGARPCIADMLPVIGPAPQHHNLWFAFGHGHQGFTLGPTTGRLLQQMMDNQPSDVDMTPFRVDRFAP